MLLKKLIKNLPNAKKQIKIRGLEINSKKVKKGYIFFAIKGQKLNGEKFIVEAIKKGAVVIVCSKNCKFSNKDVLIIKINNIRNFLSEICSKFYKYKPKNIFAVTGTNGKTSVADLFYQILCLNKIPVASIGTLGIKIKDKIIRSDLTSPNTISLHKSLEKIKKRKIENVILEASSHGLHQNRVNHLNLKAGIFTNLSQDHLDYHKNMKSYLNAKLLLFRKVLSTNKTIISDKSIKEFSLLKKISKFRRLRLIDIKKTEEKLETLNLNFNHFQKKNLSMAIEAAKLCNLDKSKIFASLKKIKDIEGRIELVKTFTNNIKVFVDFAHTPEALLQSINALKNFYNQDLSLVFGCGGDRDQKKRPIMAKIASANCKNIYVTDDNPRNESPKNIRKKILANIKNPNRFNIQDRSIAIKTAIKNAEPNELILVAGKGHEDKQIYKNKIVNISDKKIIKGFKPKIKKISNQNQVFLSNKKILRRFKKFGKLKNFDGISIDSRTTKKNNLFLTIKGKNKDGVKFIPQAIKRGAKYIITSKNIKKNKKRSIKVNNEIKFLNYFASKKRENSKAKIIAVTGSAGKTSLKNLIASLLKNFGKTFSSPKSFNNQFGVPLSLSKLDVSHKYGIFEVGMSKAGEIGALSKIIKPHVGIITNIGEAHIENFKSLKDIADAKGEIIKNIKKNGTLILNQDDKFSHYLRKKAKIRNLNLITFGLSKKSNIYPLNSKKDRKEKETFIKIKDKLLKFETKNLNIYNVLASLALLEGLKLNPSKISSVFKNLQPTEGRGKIHIVKRYKKKFKLIDESYNANPLSVKTAIKNFISIKKKNFKKYLLLGDMLELGKKSEFFHKNLSKVINNSDIDKVFIKGKKSLITYKNLDLNKRGNIFQQDDDVDFTFNSIIANNDYLMVKGSNATGLKDLSKRIIKGQ
tara:strand:- start:1409 stop:4168 length:2760 start_codon:yes stop_codon:yes gene_type:complete